MSAGSSEVKVFVYGTLKPGERYHQRYCSRYLVGAEVAIATGHLYHLPGLGYPAMTPGDDVVHGYLLRFSSPQILPSLDHLEGYNAHRSPADNEYQRQQIMIFDRQRHPLGQAWVYLMEPARVQTLNGLYLANGHWMGKDRQ